MNGMAKGILKAGGNIVAKFLENATVSAGGYVNTESILHSNVTASTEIQVTGKRGFITGGHVRAGQRIEVKTLGATLGAPTVVEVGVDPEKKAEYMKLQKEISEIVKKYSEYSANSCQFHREKKQRSVFYSGPAELYPEFRSNDGDTEKEPGGEKRAHAGIADGVQSTGKGRCHRQGRGVSGDYDHYRGFLHAGEKYLPVL